MPTRYDKTATNYTGRSRWPLANRAGGGRSWFGAVAAFRGHTGLAVANALGGILAQAAVLGVADVVARGLLQRHASNRNVMAQAALLFALVGILLCAFARPDICVGSCTPSRRCSSSFTSAACW